MIGMGVRDGHLFDVGRCNIQLGKLRRQRFRATPVDELWVGGGQAVWQGRNRIRKTGVPKEPTLFVLDKVTAVDEIHRLSFVDPWRPQGNVSGDPFSAAQDI